MLRKDFHLESCPQINYALIFRNYCPAYWFIIPIIADFSIILMNTKTTITLSSTVLAAVGLLFASAPLAVTQAHAFWGGGWGWHHPWWGWHHWGWHHPWWSWHHPWWGWHHGWGWGRGGWGHEGFGGGWGHEGFGGGWGHEGFGGDWGHEGL